MASIYSTLFFRGHVASGATDAAFTVPAGKVAVVRELVGTPYGAAAALNLEMAGPLYLWTLSGGATAYVMAIQSGRLVFKAGDAFLVHAYNADWDVAVSGYLLG